jgi:Ras/Rap GTPase-activating protein SynGAP
VLQWLRAEYSLLVEVLEPAVSVKAKEELAAVLVAVFHHFNVAQDFLTDVLVAEVNRLGELYRPVLDL